ncbi:MULTISPECIES: hypothetical protein [Tenacibaculum]
MIYFKKEAKVNKLDQLIMLQQSSVLDVLSPKKCRVLWDSL